MLFHSTEFWIFFFTVLAVFYALPFRWGKLFLIAASCFFYMWWNPRFIFLLFIPTLIDYYTALYMEGATKKRKKLLLLTSLVTNLGLLAFFKYYNFFTGSVAAVLGRPENSFYLNIVLPVGISFYTFNTLSYTIDVYRGILKPVKKLQNFALFIAFFPHLVAGPIVRAADFLPQIEKWKKPKSDFVQSGIDLILIGLIKKMVFADQFAIVADQYFNGIASHHGLYPGAAAAWSGVFAFTMQIFFDFSGYTDIARGCARVLGFEFNLNFMRPYLSQNITEFWRRWHMSLSSWLRDYLYIPLGGNRYGTFMTYRNLFITMLLGGLWHGASWNFVIWGAFHGLLLAFHRVWNQLTKGTVIAKFLGSQAALPIRVALNLFAVMIGWVFFRAATLPDSLTVIRGLFSFGIGTSLMSVGLWVLTGVSLTIAVLEESQGLIAKVANWYGMRRAWIYCTALLVLKLFSNLDQKIPFVYFQF